MFIDFQKISEFQKIGSIFAKIGSDFQKIGSIFEKIGVGASSRLAEHRVAAAAKHDLWRVAAPLASPDIPDCAEVTCKLQPAQNCDAWHLGICMKIPNCAETTAQLALQQIVKRSKWCREKNAFSKKLPMAGAFGRDTRPEHLPRSQSLARRQA